MCCLFTVLVLLGPRVALILWWLFDMARFSRTFSSFIIPVIGWLILPWTTIAYVLVWPGGIAGLDWLWLGLGVIIDVSTHGGGVWGNRGRLARN